MRAMGVQQDKEQFGEDGFLRSVLDASLDCIKVIELNGHLSYMNANGLCAMEIDDFAQISRKRWWELWPSEREQQIKAAIEVGKKGGTARFEAFCPTMKGTPKWWDVSVSPVMDRNGNVTGLVSISRDITDRKRAEQDLRDSERRAAESERRLSDIVDCIDQMIWSTRPDGYHDFYNKRWYEFTGVPEGSTDGEAWNDMFHPDDRERAWETWRRSLASGQPYHIEYRLRHHSGRYRWVLGRAQCVRDENGQIVRWYGTCTDIDELKQAEEKNEILSRELSHRIKNIFAVISGIVTISSRDRPESKSFAHELQQRIGALGVAHDYVRPHSPDSAPPYGPKTFQGLLNLLLAPYKLDSHATIVVRGPDVSIGSKAATPIALVLHELATNATKYGALSSADGHLSIESQEEDGHYVVLWRERGGPVLNGPPNRAGFGTLLSDRILSAQLEAQVSRTWLHEGLDLRLAIPLARLHM